MGKKYIIELDDNQIAYATTILDGMPYIKLLQTILYTAPDLEQVREEAYEDGYKTAKVQCNIQAEKDLREVGKRHYQKGLDDLWEAMQKAIKMYCEIDNEVFLRVFHDVKSDWGESVLQALFKNTPQHLIDSIRQYEQKQEMDGLRQNIQTIVDQCGYTLDEIAAVLEKMREGREQ